jgi:hypothetical protein
MGMFHWKITRASFLWFQAAHGVVEISPYQHCKSPVMMVSKGKYAQMAELFKLVNYCT